MMYVASALFAKAGGFADTLPVGGLIAGSLVTGRVHIGLQKP